MGEQTNCLMLRGIKGRVKRNGLIGKGINGGGGGVEEWFNGKGNQWESKQMI